MNNYDLSNIKIEKNIPIPKQTGGRDNKWFVFFTKMSVNDSFAMPFETEEECRKIKTAIQAAKRKYIRDHNPDFNGTYRILFNKKEVRFWRDK